MELKAVIERYLREQSAPKKAREIAVAIKTDVKLVNSCLYKNLNGSFQKDPEARWTLRKPSSNGSRQPGAAQEDCDTPLARVCRYYLACLAKDATYDVSAWASSKYGAPSYAELRALPSISDDPAVWRDGAAAAIIGRFRARPGRSSMFVGYPTVLRRFRARSGGEYSRIEPIVLFEYKLDDGKSGSPVLADERPSINHGALKTLTGENSSELMTEVVELSNALGIGAGIDPDDFFAAIAHLSDLRSDWQWLEPLDPAKTVGEVPLAELAQGGIYNRAVLMLAERPTFTRGLESELEALAGQSDAVSKTALGTWLGDVAVQPEGRKPELIEILPLNLEQREAVRRAMREPLTVITGPPGTGKSQVVASIIANCVWNRQTVLFASKNNKAVEVVHTRVNALGPRPILLRVGAAEASAELPDHLASVLASTATDDDQARFEHVKTRFAELAKRRDHLEASLAETIELRNTVDRLEQQVEAAREILGTERFRSARSEISAETEHLLQRVKAVVAAAVPERQGVLTRLLWRFHYASRVSAARESLANLIELADRVGVQLPSLPPDTRSAASAFPAIQEIERRVPLVRRVGQYLQAVEQLSAAMSPEAIAGSLLELSGLTQDVSSELWSTWLALKPKSITQEQRRAIGEYKAAVELLASTSLKRPGSLLRKAQKLFPTVVKAIPAWAVTNLSAKGRLPFMPGYFDLLVIDEASQCDIASALPLLFRARRAVIIGDPNQLQHITQIKSEIDAMLLADQRIDESPGLAWSYSRTSLFGLASAIAPSDVISLRDHHRSHADIIGFSNKHFYEGRLRVATRHDRLKPRPAGDPAIRWLHVAGKAIRPSAGGVVNDIEAQRVIQELERLFLTSGYRGSVGVVSPFRAQANRIRDLVHRNEQLVQAASNAELLIDTVHKFQGDERDLMIFSPVVAHGTPVSGLRFLENQRNLFNVAITRARSCLMIIGDFVECQSCSVKYLSSFTDYVSSVGKADAVFQPQAGAELGPEYPAVSRPDRVSDWERHLYRMLYAAGIRTMPQYPVEQYDLDLALFDGDRRLDIEVDGEWHRDWSGELSYRDQLRNQRLIELGWDVMRFWVYQIRDEPDKCVERVRRWLTSPAATAQPR